VTNQPGDLISMDEPTTPGIGCDGTPCAEDGLVTDSQDQGQGNTIGVPSDNLPLPPGNIQDGLDDGKIESTTRASDDAEDFVHIDINHQSRRSSSAAGFDTEAVPQPVVAATDTVSTVSHPGAHSTHEADGSQLVRYNMQLIHIPKQPRSRLSRLARAEVGQVQREGSQSPPAPPPGLFKPSGIAYLNREWVQLSGAPLPSTPSDLASDDEANAAGGHEQSRETHNPFDFVAGKDDSEESRKFPDSHLFPRFSEMKPSSSSGEPSAGSEWERQKRELKEKNDALDQLMAMEGLEEVKREFLRVKATIDEARKRKGWLKRQDLNLVLMGNPGTGMTRPMYLHKGKVGAWAIHPHAATNITSYFRRN